MHGESLAGDVMVGCDGPRLVVRSLDEVIRRSPRLVNADSTLYQISLNLMLRAEQPF